jgi:DNA-directed RNA polymerase subunit RPC12/RpoP
MGQVAPVLQDEQRRPVYLCSQCGQRFPQTTIDQEYRLLKMRDRGS